ncbi:hypothetical protein ATANTOWER_012205 [Ataeniobius toweri]|uniref:Uncharacterized protein n=1 Tax=Ataeniobius toweri TaxID=208326 RepID=A0ABU7BYE4_9TELE|nr:hypothetical protein [Ataeniobius toweri]
MNNRGRGEEERGGSTGLSTAGFLGFPGSWSPEFTVLPVWCWRRLKSPRLLLYLYHTVPRTRPPLVGTMVPHQKKIITEGELRGWRDMGAVIVHPEVEKQKNEEVKLCRTMRVCSPSSSSG